jgi:NADH-quinone oxidoreductase subunit M
MSDSWLLNVVIFLPLAFAAGVALFPAGEKGVIRAATFVGMVVSGLATLWLYLAFDASAGGAEFQFQFRTEWIPTAGIGYHIGVDGLAVSLILLTGFLGPFVVLASWGTIHERVKEFHISLLVLQTAMMGAVAALDLVLFYVFWEAMLIPMYLLVGVWGSEDRIMAAVKFFLYTLVGSFLMLVAIIALYFIATPEGAERTFNYAAIYNSLLGANREVAQCALDPAACANLSPMASTLRAYAPWLFFAFALAFAIKVPMWPVHTWLPDAHVQAPMAGSIILAGVMLKMGTFGFWRYAFPLFPTAARDWAVLLGVLSVIGIIYGALMCLAQRDIKKLIAYSSVSHLGFCMLGMVAMSVEGAAGAAYQMLNHGIATGALFLLFGLLYDRRHSRLMADYGGVAKVMPIFTAAFLIITFASVAVPGTNGFVGEFLILLGTFKGQWLHWGFGAAAAVAVILAAAYMLWMVQRVFFGEMTHRETTHLKDFNVREIVTVAPFVVLVIVMGLMPQPFLERLEPAAKRFVARSTLSGEPGVEIVALAPPGAGTPALGAPAAGPQLHPDLPRLRPLPMLRDDFQPRPSTRQ